MWILTLPVVTWIICGGLKFAVNFWRFGGGALKRIGLGGFPSNHAAIASSLLWALAFAGEWKIAALALGMLMIHVFDATSLRREVGRHAAVLNTLTEPQLREIVGHNAWEIAGGLAVGFAVAWAYWSIGIPS